MLNMKRSEKRCVSEWGVNKCVVICVWAVVAIFLSWIWSQCLLVPECKCRMEKPVCVRPAMEDGFTPEPPMVPPPQWTVAGRLWHSAYGVKP